MPVFTSTGILTQFSYNDVAKKTFAVIPTVEGVLRFRHATQVEDQSVSYMIVDFESRARRDQLIQAGPISKVEGDTKLFSSSLKIIRSTLGPQNAFEEVFSSAVIELTVLSLKDKADHSRNALREIILAIRATVNVTPTAHGMLQGYLEDGEDDVMLYVGWNSVEAHLAVIASPEGQNQRKRLDEICIVNTKHLTL